MLIVKLHKSSQIAPFSLNFIFVWWCATHANFIVYCDGRGHRWPFLARLVTSLQCHSDVLCWPITSQWLKTEI